MGEVPCKLPGPDSGSGGGQCGGQIVSGIGAAHLDLDVQADKDDQTEMLPARMADEFRRSETERQQAKIREAEKRKREAAAMDMPPPDSWSVVTGRNRPRAIQSSSRLDPGEGHSRWGEPSRKKLAAKATMGPTEQLFQRGEKEKSTNEGSGKVFSSQVQVQVQVQRGEKEKSANEGSSKGYGGQLHMGEREKSTAANVSQG